MTPEEQYTHDQDAWLKEHGLGVGSPVITAREFTTPDTMSVVYEFDKLMKANLGKVGIINSICENHIRVLAQDGEWWLWPYTSLDPVPQEQPEAPKAAEAKRGAGKEKAMSSPTELEKLWQKLSEGDYDYVPLIDIQNAIAAEKQRVCANCKHCKPFDINNWRGDVDNKDTASYFEATDDCFSKSPGVLTIFLGEGYCHKFTPREEQK